MPNGDDQNVHLVEDLFRPARLRLWREADAKRTDQESVISDLMSGQHNNQTSRRSHLTMPS